MTRGSQLSSQASPDCHCCIVDILTIDHFRNKEPNEVDYTLQVKRFRVIPTTFHDIALAYRVNDAAEVSGLSRSTIYNLIAEKKLRSIMVAGRRLIPADALRDLIEGATAA